MVSPSNERRLRAQQTQMPDFLEFHDSTIVSVATDQQSLHIGIDAYVHRWQKVEGRWMGSGWVQPVRITLSESITWPHLGLPAGLTSGRVEMDGRAYDLVPLPHKSQGRVTVTLALTTGEVIEVIGADFTVEAIADGRLAEDLPDEFREHGLVAERLLESGTPHSGSGEDSRSPQRRYAIACAIREVLMRHWDPIGVADIPEAQDEYDSYIGGVYQLLASGADDMRMASHLAAIQTERMGLPKQAVFLMDVARRLREIDVSR